MHKKIISLAVMAAMSAIQIPPKMKTQSNRIGLDGNRKKKKSSGKWIKRLQGKHKPHQGKQECARRLREGSPAWHSRMAAKRLHWDVGV